MILLLFCSVFFATLPALGNGIAAASHSGGTSADTGFLNRSVTLHGVTYKFQVYVPEEWRHDDRQKWPIILFLHGRGERGGEGMWQTQSGLPQAVRDHPERWPFIIVMPQCPLKHFWTDPEMLQMATMSLDQESREFHGDPERTYLTGLSLGGYGSWELAKMYPHRWAAIAIASGGVFWSYAPERWREQATLPAEYAQKLGRTPIWLFHGTDDPTVVVKQDELMFNAFRQESGHIRLWLYQGLKHDSWSRAYNEPELPRWLLAHHLGQNAQLPELAERTVIPLHPPIAKVPEPTLESYVGDYFDNYNILEVSILRQNTDLYQRTLQGEVRELLPESPSTFFFASGGLTRLTFERDNEGRVVSILFHDDRHDERWYKRH